MACTEGIAMTGIIRTRLNEETGAIEVYDVRCADCIDFAPEWNEWCGDREATEDDADKCCVYCHGDVFSTSEPVETGMQYAGGFVFVNVYELDRVYGGPEEGGWYFTTGTFITGRQVPKDHADEWVSAFRADYPTVDEVNRQALEAWEAEGCPGRPPARQYRYDSVCYAGGHYDIYVEDKPGADFPEIYPHYE